MVIEKTINRPWGKYVFLKESDKYKVIKIVVNPKSELSLQTHEKRSEHWVVVSGKGRVQLDNKSIDLKINDYIFINNKQKHRLINNSNDDLVVIEVRTGEYLEDDDIIRY